MKLVSWPGGMLAAMAGLVIGFGLGWKSNATKADLSDPIASPKVQSNPDDEKKNEVMPAAAQQTSRGAPSSPEEKPSSKGLVPKKQFVRLAFERWTKEQRHHLLWELFIHTPAAQHRLFEHLMTTTDAGAWEAGEDYLIATNDKDLARQIAEAFERETNPARRTMLAYALAGNANHPVTHAGLQRALDTQDEAMLKRVLARLTMSNLMDFPDTSIRVEARLRPVVASGLSEEVRVAAVGALRGGPADDRTRFLLDLALRDPNPAIQRAALGSLPMSYMSHPPLLKEQLDVLWLVARDSSREERIRRTAAEYLRDRSRFNRMPISEADKAMLESLLEKKD